MSVILQYKASSGNVYNLKNDGIRTRTANYHSWSWGVVGTTLQLGTRVSGFTRAAITYETVLALDGSPSRRKAILEALHDDFELDVRNMTPGRIIWGDYYIECYIVMSSTEPDDYNVYTNNELEIYCPHPFWIKEETRQFLPQEAPGEQDYLDYNFDYEYDYFYGNPGIAIWDTGFPFTSDFRMTVYGPVINPQIFVNEYQYAFFDTLEASEYVIIDSQNNKITKYLASGRQVNIFDKRNKAESVFKQMPAGSLTINWSGTFGFDLTLLEERSEPRWST